MSLLSGIKRKSSLMMLLVSLMIIFVICGFQGKITMLMTKEIESQLIEETEQNSLIIQEKLKRSFADMSTIALMIQTMNQQPAMNVSEREAFQREINTIKERCGVVAVGGVNIRGEVIYGPPIEVSTLPHIKDALRGRNIVSYISWYSLSGRNNVIVTVPIYQDSRVIGAAYGIYPVSVLKNDFKVNFLGGAGDAFICDKEGNLIIPTGSDKQNQNLRRIFYQWKTSDNPVVGELNDKLRDKRQGVERFKLDENRDMYIACVPMSDVADFYAFSMIPVKVLTDKISNILFLIAVMLGILSLSIIFFLVYIELSRSQSEKMLYDMAYVDKLTNIGNREKLRMDFIKLINDAENKNQQYAFASCDINKFKLINDIFTFEHGDKILKELALFLSKNMRKGELICRSNEDVFMFVLRCYDEEKLFHRLEKMFNEFSDTYYHRYSRKLSFACGISFFQNIKDENALAVLIDEADLARKSAKRHTHTQLVAFDSQMKRDIIDEKDLEDDLDEALTREEFQVYLQPKYCLSPEHLNGAEALVRWEHPVKGLLSPYRFIPLLERRGLIARLDFYMFEHVCRLFRQWKEDKMPLYPISVNMSRITLMNNTNFFEDACMMADRYGVPHQLINFEITETSAQGNKAVLIELMNKLRGAEFTISMDDFGSGYSSLGLLKELPIDVMKLDKGFFDDWSNKRDNVKEKGILEAVMLIAKRLGLETVAEGIEEKEQIEYLRSIGCHMVQSYYFAKPMPVEQYEALLIKDTNRG